MALPPALELMSKEISRVLRHKPASIGIALDSAGWCSVAELLERMAEHGKPITMTELTRIVSENDKKRFALSPDGSRIRASQGHSISSVKLDLREKLPPSRLFHGTSQAAIASIRKNGLLPMGRQQVHLSVDVGTAMAVAQRRPQPNVLTINSAAMSKAGHKFYLSENGVWLTETVPPKFIHFDGEPLPQTVRKKP